MNPAVVAMIAVSMVTLSLVAIFVTEICRLRSIVACYPNFGNSMTFAEFTRGNRTRCIETFKRSISPDSGIAFALGVGEESGEVLGKVRAYHGITKRKAGVTVEEIGAEVADLVHYADLTAACYGLRLEDCLQAKYNYTSKRSGSNLRFESGRLFRDLTAS